MTASLSGVSLLNEGDNCSLVLTTSGNSVLLYVQGLVASWHLAVSCKFGG
jgi:hypothetical protein